MIPKAGQWRGRGSFRATTESLGVTFRANIQVSEDARVGHGLLIEATLDVDGGGQRSIMVWIVADEFGTYAIKAQGWGIDVNGTGKLESEPHLGLLWSDDGDIHVAFALFELPESHGLRGFAKTAKDLWTWELALHGEQRADKRSSRLQRSVGNVVSLAARRRK